MVKEVSYKKMTEYVGLMFCRERIHQGITQEKVAESMQRLGFDIGQPAISKIEKGERNIYFPELCALLHIFDISLVDFAKYVYNIILTGKSNGWTVY